ncbi:MAG: ParB/RepB/Spo0J family partition protein [Bacteroidota bacterium]|nr:ParB/RepB/Spo0J family partition protein [Bacteroidota bacterium]
MAAAKKSALGRGLDALISEPEETEITKNEAINEVELISIDVNPYQPRTNFDQETLDDLTSSILELGLIQPITVREMDNGRFQIISGERRVRASRNAGLSSIPAYIRKANDQGMLEMALVENIQRQDLDAIEIAISYQRLMEECNLIHEDLSKRVGKGRSTISNYLRLLKLPVEIQKGIRNKKIGMGHARALVVVDDTDMQLKISLKIIEEDLSVRKTEELVRKFTRDKDETAKPGKPAANEAKEYSGLEKHLIDYFDTPIQFKRAKNGKGQIVIHFASDDDLERIVGILDRLNK